MKSEPSRSKTTTTAGPVRIALLSTPRSGNTWLRHLLGAAYGVPMVASHALETEADWAALPEELILQLHWGREAGLVDRLAAEGFRVVTVARHPFDVLISILHVAVHDVQSERWLGGRGGDEASIWGAWPRHPAFLDYATGPRASALLGVGREWWAAPGVVRARYEAMVADPVEAFREVVRQLGPARVADLGAVVEANSFRNLQWRLTNNHFWMGRPGLWRTLLPTAETGRLVAAHGSVLETMGYDGTPDPALDAEGADRRWLELVGPELGKTLRKNTDAFIKQREQTQREAWELVSKAEEATRAAWIHCATERGHYQTKVAEQAAEIERLTAALAVTQAAAERAGAELVEARAGAERAVAEAERFRALEGPPIRVARRYQAWSERHPKLARRVGALLAPSDLGDSSAA